MPSSRPPLARVLILEEDAAHAATLMAALDPSCVCEVASSSGAALDAISRNLFDVVLSNERVDGTSGLDLLAAVDRCAPGTPFIMMAGEADAPAIAEARRRAGFASLSKPIDGGALSQSVRRAIAERDRIERSPPSRTTETTAIGSSPGFLAALDAVERVSHSSAPVLLVGETGTGKDVLAARIHARGPRRQRPYVVVNAGAIQSTLLDSELFGHVAGAFTGATRARRGLVAEADGGTLFLDEIVDLPLELQGRLLRVVETGYVRAIGADQERHVDVRFLAATHHDLAIAVREGRFREDLFFRLNVLSIQVPPLRERREDISLLARYFFERARARNPRSPVKTLSTSALKRLSELRWSGNVRELASVIERAVVLVDHEVLVETDFAGRQTADAFSERWAGEELLSLKALTARYTEWVLAQCNGDKARAAAVLRVDISTLYRWKKKRAD